MPKPDRRSARSLVARTLLVALLLPTVFALTSPDPRWFLGIETETAEHDHSAIPGSPGHPADHDCAPCQALKYLALCLPQPKLLVPAAAPAKFPPVARDQAQRAGHFASLPPSRAPPRAAA